MTMSLLDPIDARASSSPAQQLRVTTAAVRVSLRWLGVRKTLTPAQKSEAAESFGAQGDFLSARKKLLDTGHVAYKAVSAVRGKVIAYWKGMTLPYPEPGVRLIKQAQVEPFDAQMRDYCTELEAGVQRLQEHYSELQAAARRRLGRLYNPADYPPTLTGLFGIEWDFPAVEPPDYLMHISPAIYEQERARVAGRFEEAIRLAEEGFASEFAKIVSHLTERLNQGSEGEKKVFRDSAITNLVEFFGRFRELNVCGNDQLERLVEQAQRIVRGVEPQALRDNAQLRQHVTTQLSQVQSVIDGMMVDRPRRRIIRANSDSNGGTHDAGD